MGRRGEEKAEFLRVTPSPCLRGVRSPRRRARQWPGRPERLHATRL